MIFYEELNSYTMQQCTRCGRRRLALTTVVSASKAKAQHLCPICFSSEGGRKTINPDTVEDYDQLISRFKSLSNDLKDIAQQARDLKDDDEDDLPDDLKGFAFTPMSAYQGAQSLLAHLEKKKEEAQAQQKQ